MLRFKCVNKYKEIVMTRPIHPIFKEHSLQSIAEAEGLVVICADAAGSFGPSAKRVNRLMKGALRKFADSEIFEKMDEGDIQRFPAPLGLSANAVLLLKMKKRPSVEIAQKCGANIAKEAGKSNIHLFVTANARAAHLSFGIALRRYNFNEYKTHNQTDYGSLHVYITNVSKTKSEYSDLSAVIDGVFFTRDLVNEPANILTTTEFANRIQGLEKLGLKINVLEERIVDGSIINYTIKENDIEINVFFNNEDYNLIGWQNIDVYQNFNITFVSSIRKNRIITKNIFKLPTQN